MNTQVGGKVFEEENRKTASFANPHAIDALVKNQPAP